MSEAVVLIRTGYVYVTERADDGGYWAYLPDLPGCATTAATAEQVERQLPEAVGLYLAHSRERGLTPPPRRRGSARCRRRERHSGR